MKINSTIAATLIAVLSTQSAHALTYNLQSPIVCQPVRIPKENQYFLQPQRVAQMLEDLRREMGDERLRKALGEPALTSLNSYVQLDKNQIRANFAAAAAAGAAVAVVEYVWDKVVGNGPKNDKLTRDDYFDIQGLPPRRPQFPQNPEFSGTQPVVGTVIPKLAGYPTTIPQGGRNPNGNPQAMTPVAVAVAEATAGAAAYKAVEYSLKKAFGDKTGSEGSLNPRQFDLHQ